MEKLLYIVEKCNVSDTDTGEESEGWQQQLKTYKKLIKPNKSQKDCYLLTVFKKRSIDLSNNLDIGIPVSSEYCFNCSQSFVSTAFEIAVLVVNPLFFFIKSPQINNNICLQLMSS